jgi:hypothetical protein
LFFAAIGGLFGFFVLIIAGLIYFILAVWRGGFGFGAALLSPSESFAISFLVSVFISFGAGIPAWVLRANRWQGLLAGLVAMVVFTYISNMGQDINYAPFIEYDTLAYVSAILVSVGIATFRKNKIRIIGVAILIALTAEIFRWRSFLLLLYPYDEQMIGFVASLLAWIFLPLIAAFFIRLEKNKKIINLSIDTIGSNVTDQFQKSKWLFAMAAGIFVLFFIFSVLEYQESRRFSTPELIDKAYVAGRISEEERLLYLAYAIFEYESLPARFHSNIGWSGTSTIMELSQAANSPSVLCSMSPEIRSEFQRLLEPKITCE